jgi:hypothetical protein
MSERPSADTGCVLARQVSEGLEGESEFIGADELANLTPVVAGEPTSPVLERFTALLLVYADHAPKG